MLPFLWGYMLIHGAEAKGWEYKKINAAKRQKNQQGFGNLTGLKGKNQNSALERQSKVEGLRSQRKVMQRCETYWFPPKTFTEFSSCPDQEVKNPCRKPR